MDITHKFILLDGLLVGCCDGIFSVAKAALPLAQHTRFLGCDLNPECLASSPLQLALILACQILSEQSGISGTKDVRQPDVRFVLSHGIT